MAVSIFYFLLNKSHAMDPYIRRKILKGTEV